MHDLISFCKTYSHLSEEALKNLARDIALVVHNPMTFCFYGDLGSGKSTFCRQFIQTFLNDTKHIVPSPTFTLVQDYLKDDQELYHFDLYRLNSTEDLIELNIEECLLKGICLIEWPQKIEHFILEKRFDIHITKEDDDHRSVTMRYFTLY